MRIEFLPPSWCTKIMFTRLDTIMKRQCRVHETAVFSHQRRPVHPQQQLHRPQPGIPPLRPAPAAPQGKALSYRRKACGNAHETQCRYRPPLPARRSTSAIVT